MVFCYTSCGLGPCQSLFTEMGMIFESSHIAGTGSRVTKDVPAGVLQPLLPAEVHTGGAGVHHSSLNRQVPLHAVLRITQLQTPFVPGISVSPNVVMCACSKPPTVWHACLGACNTGLQIPVPTQPGSRKPFASTEV